MAGPRNFRAELRGKVFESRNVQRGNSFRLYAILFPFSYMYAAMSLFSLLPTSIRIYSYCHCQG